MKMNDYLISKSVMFEFGGGSLAHFFTQFHIVILWQVSILGPMERCTMVIS
jgi:hypothetical protein